TRFSRDWSSDVCSSDLDPPIVIGIDVSKAELVIAVQPTGERWTSATTPAPLDAVVTRLQAAHPTLIVLEASGGYEAPLVAACAKIGKASCRERVWGRRV